MSTPENLKANVIRMQQAGVPEAEISNYIKTYGSSIESPEGFKLRRGQNPPREVDTRTSNVTPTPEESLDKKKNLAAAGVRYGIPTAAGIAAPQLSVPVMLSQALLAGGSEYVARKIETIGKDPVIESNWADLEAAGLTGAVDLGLSATLRGAGSVARYLGGKLLIPSKLPRDIEIAQNTLSNTPAAPETGILTRFHRWMQGKPASRPFSLTGGQINAEEKNFIVWLEGIARAGMWSKGKMAKFDLRNTEVIENAIERYTADRATKLSGPEFGAFATRIIGNLDLPGAKDIISSIPSGEMFLPVQAYRKYLYKQFEDSLAQSGATIDGTSLRRYLREFGDIEGGLPRSVYAELRSMGLVPPLEPAATKSKTTINTRTQKVTDEEINEYRKLQRTNLKTGKVKDIEDTTTGTRAKGNESTSQTIRETETVGGMTEQELAKEWSTLPAKDVNQIIKTINSHWKDGLDQHNGVINRLGGEIEGEFMRIIRSDPTLNQLHSVADEFFKKEVYFMRNAAIKGLRKTLENSPTKALSLLGDGSSPVREVYDRLISVRDALNFSAATPRIGQSLQNVLSQNLAQAGQSAGRYTSAQAQQEFERTFLRPLRYRLITRTIDEATGRFEPSKFLSFIEQNKEVPEFFDLVFGGPQQLDKIKELMTTLSVLQRNPKEKSVFIQMAQASALIGGITTVFAADSPEVKFGGLVGGAAIMLSPVAFAKLLTNAELISGLTKGLNEGVRSGRFAISLRKIAEMSAASEFMRESPSEEAMEFYTTTGQPEQQ